ncbi:hypothetical protein ABZX51_000576 [Aspergillus tubingensis]
MRESPAFPAFWLSETRSLPSSPHASYKLLQSFYILLGHPFGVLIVARTVQIRSLLRPCRSLPCHGVIASSGAYCSAVYASPDLTPPPPLLFHLHPSLLLDG